jgi:pimeloyl-ACP methyl ester carboxylesterase
MPTRRVEISRQSRRPARRTWLWWLVAFAAVIMADRATATTPPAPVDPYSRPGTLAKLPDHRVLNFRCAGSGSPTVILEAGFGAGSNAWSAVQSRISPITRVCAYDRAGYGFSDPGPMPRDGAAIARDLDFGLRAAQISGPFVVVGHSAGGLYARLFAARRRRDVVGLVFVDSSVEHQTQRIAALFGRTVGGIEGVRRRPSECLAAVRAPSDPANEAARLSCAPATLDAHARVVALRPETYVTQLSELDTLFTTTSDEVDRVGGLLHTVPGIVLTAAKADAAPAGKDDPGAVVWQHFHRELAATLLKGDQRLVRSSHLMMIDRPEVVSGAAIELVRKARAH